MESALSKGPHTFKQRELTRAIKAAKAAGKEVGELLIEPGRVKIVLKDEAAPKPEREKEWDAVR